MINLELIYESILRFIEAHIPYISPFWGWLLDGAGVIAICLAIGWAFSSLRPFAGAVIMAVIAALFGYHRGEDDQAKHDRHGPYK